MTALGWHKTTFSPFCTPTVSPLLYSTHTNTRKQKVIFCFYYVYALKMEKNARKLRIFNLLQRIFFRSIMTAIVSDAAMQVVIYLSSFYFFYINSDQQQSINQQQVGKLIVVSTASSLPFNWLTIAKVFIRELICCRNI